MQAISAHDAQRAGGGGLLEGEALPVAIGDVVAGKYKVDAILGIGGMGVVVAATHSALGQRVAMKVMRTTQMSPETADRFLSEARAAVSLKSSHVAKVLDVGTLRSGLPFMVMELLHGEDLAAKLHRRGALPCDEAIDYILQACDAIAEAHALGIVHRDLKPENLFVTERRDGTPFVKVLDFGISKVTPSLEVTVTPTSRRAVTHESTVMGSPMYMSPEQIRSAKHVDGRTDVWALGAILYELVAGHGAFWAPSVPDIFVKVLDKPAPRLEDAMRDPPPGLAGVIARCLEKDRDRRYETVDALAIELANLGARTKAATIPPWDRSTDVPMNGSDAMPVNAALPATFAPLSAERRRRADTYVLPSRRRAPLRQLMAVFALLSLAGMGLGGAALYRRGAAAKRAAIAAAAASAAAPPAASVANGPTTDPAGTAESASSGEPPASTEPAGAGAAAGATAGATALGGGSKRTTGGASRPRATSLNGAKGSEGASARGPRDASGTPAAQSSAATAPATTRTSPVPTLHRTDW